MNNNLEKQINVIEDLINQVEKDMILYDKISAQEKALKRGEIEKNLSSISDAISKGRQYLKSISQNRRAQYEADLNSFESKRADLAIELRKKVDAAHNDPRSRQQMQIDENKDKTSKISGMLDEALNLTIDTNTTGQATNQMLAEDRNRLNRINSNLVNIENEGVMGETRAKKMLRRVLLNDFLAWTIVVILVIILGIVIFLKLRK